MSLHHPYGGERNITRLTQAGGREASFEHFLLHFQEDFTEQVDNPKAIFFLLFTGFQRSNLLPPGC